MAIDTATHSHRNSNFVRFVDMRPKWCVDLCVSHWHYSEFCFDLVGRAHAQAHRVTPESSKSPRMRSYTWRRAHFSFCSTFRLTCARALAHFIVKDVVFDVRMPRSHRDRNMEIFGIDPTSFIFMRIRESAVRAVQSILKHTLTLRPKSRAPTELPSKNARFVLNAERNEIR